MSQPRTSQNPDAKPSQTEPPQHGNGKRGLTKSFFARITDFDAQKKAAAPIWIRTFWSDVFAAYRTALKPNQNAVIKESFDESMARLGTTEESLVVSFRSLRLSHWVLYVVSAALCLYFFYLAMNGQVLVGLSVLCASVGAAVNGYISGFRAWQIRNRRLISLQRAIRIADTYLVI